MLLLLSGEGPSDLAAVQCQLDSVTVMRSTRTDGSTGRQIVQEVLCYSGVEDVPANLYVSKQFLGEEAIGEQRQNKRMVARPGKNVQKPGTS